MNRNRPFSDLYNHYSDLSTSNIKLHPLWVLGFIDGEGCFGTLITKSEEGVIVTRNRLSVSQSTHDYAVLKALKGFLKAGYLNPTENSIDSLDKAKLCQNNSFYYNSIPETFLPFFDKYPLLTRKNLDYLDFKTFYLLKKDKYHLTDKGFDLMKDLALKMNSGRDDVKKSRRK